MKRWLLKHAENISLAAVELIVGISLFFYPVQVSAVFVILIGISFILIGCFKIKQHIFEDDTAHKHSMWQGLMYLSLGLALVIKSTSIKELITNQLLVVGTVLFACSMLKVEQLSNILRAKTEGLLWNSINAVISTVLSALMLFGVLTTTKIPYVLGGISYLICCILDVITLLPLRHRKIGTVENESVAN